MTFSSDGSVDESWRVQLFIAARDGNVDYMQRTAGRYPKAIHENFCEFLGDGMLEWESLKW